MKNWLAGPKPLQNLTQRPLHDREPFRIFADTSGRHTPSSRSVFIARRGVVIFAPPIAISNWRVRKYSSVLSAKSDSWVRGIE